MVGNVHRMSCFGHNPNIFSLLSQRRKETSLLLIKVVGNYSFNQLIVTVNQW